MQRLAIGGGIIIGIVACSDYCQDLSVSDVHFQFWMLLVTGIILLLFVYVLGDAVAFALPRDYGCDPERQGESAAARNALRCGIRGTC